MHEYISVYIYIYAYMNNSTLYTYLMYIQCICVYTGCVCVCILHVLAVVNNATENTGCRHLFDMVLFHFNVFSEMELPGHIVILFLIFEEGPDRFSKCLHLPAFPPTGHGLPFPRTLASAHFLSP